MSNLKHRCLPWLQTDLTVATRLLLRSLLASLVFAGCGFKVQGSQAFFFEPYVGLSKMEARIGSALDVADGFYLGAKAGLNVSKKFFLGIDYQTAGPYKFHEPLDFTEWNLKMLGAGIGLDYRIIRFWLGGYFDANIEHSESSATLEGQAVKVGFGLVVSRLLRANLEYIIFDIKKIKTGSSSVENEQFAAKATQVSISLPF